jgi:phage recombination protein Bet
MSNLVQTNWDSSQIEIIKQQIAKGCSDGELALFGQVCQRTGLDPFSRQIYAISRGGKMTVQVSIDGFRTIAARSGLYGGSVTEWCGEDGIWCDVWLGSGNPSAAKTTVWRNGSPHPFVGVAKFSSYSQGQGLWGKMPDTMIGKVSESLALRKAFPAELSGLYTKEEMDQSEPAPSNRINQFRQTLVECFQILGWDRSKQKEWGLTLHGKPSAEWSLTEWEQASVIILSEVDTAAPVVEAETA